MGLRQIGMVLYKTNVLMSICVNFKPKKLVRQSLAHTYTVWTKCKLYYQNMINTVTSGLYMVK